MYKKAAKLTGILNKIQSYAVKLYIYTASTIYVAKRKRAKTAIIYVFAALRLIIPSNSILKRIRTSTVWVTSLHFFFAFYYIEVYLQAYPIGMSTDIDGWRWMCIVHRHTEMELQTVFFLLCFSPTSFFLFFFYFCQFQIKNRNKFTFVRSGCCCCCSSCYCQRKETYGKIEIEFLLRRIRCERVHTNSFRNSPGIYLYLTYLASIWFECDISWRTKLTHVV